MKKKKSIIIIGSVAGVLILGACYTLFISPLLKKDRWVYKEETVQRGTLTVGVTESGSLEYNESYINYDLDVSAYSSDDSSDSDDDSDDGTVEKYLVVEEIYAATGQRVEEGDELLKLSDSSVSSVRKLLENSLIDAKADYNDALSDYELGVLEAEITYEKSVTESKYADLIYSYSSSDVTAQIQSISTQILTLDNKTSDLYEKLDDAQEAYDEAYSAYSSAKASYEANGDPNQYYSNYKTVEQTYYSALNTYNNAKSSLQQAKDNITSNEQQIAELQTELKSLSGGKTIDQLETEQTHELALTEGDNATVVYNAAVANLTDTLQEAQDELDEAQDKLDAFEDFVGDEGIIYAPDAGIITQTGFDAGDELTQNGTIFAYTKAENMTISVDVTQEDIVGMKVGDAVQIEFTAYEGEIYQGSILSIDTTSTSSDSATVSYAVVLGVEGDTSKLYGGMVADVTFVTEQKTDVLYISRQAIVEENGKKYVYVDSASGGKELTEVETGINNGEEIEIVSGLEEGQKIYIASKVSSTSEVGTDDTGSSDNSESTSDTSENTFGNTSGDGSEFSLPDGSSTQDFPGDGSDMPSMPDGSSMPNFSGDGSDMPSMPDGSSMPDMSGSGSEGFSGGGMPSAPGQGGTN